MRKIVQKVVLPGADASNVRTSMNKNGNPTLFIVVGAALIILAGVGTGYVLAQNGESGITSGSSPKSIDDVLGKKNVVGSLNKVFTDEAEGKLEKGGIDGEGTHHLVRPGGPSQYVYLLSSVINLEEYVGKEVKVWGRTYAAQKAGWLMDVGRLEVK